MKQPAPPSPEDVIRACRAIIALDEDYTYLTPGGRVDLARYDLDKPWDDNAARDRLRAGLATVEQDSTDIPPLEVLRQWLASHDVPRRLWRKLETRVWFELAIVNTAREFDSSSSRRSLYVGWDLRLEYAGQHAGCYAMIQGEALRQIHLAQLVTWMQQAITTRFYTQLLVYYRQHGAQTVRAAGAHRLCAITPGAGAIDRAKPSPQSEPHPYGGFTGPPWPVPFAWYWQPWQTAELIFEAIGQKHPEIKYPKNLVRLDGMKRILAEQASEQRQQAAIDRLGVATGAQLVPILEHRRAQSRALALEAWRAASVLRWADQQRSIIHRRQP